MSPTDDFDSKVLEHAAERLRTLALEDERREKLESENASLKREIASLRRNGATGSSQSSFPRRSASHESLMEQSPSERRRMAAFRTKTHRFVVRDVRDGDEDAGDVDDVDAGVAADDDGHFTSASETFRAVESSTAVMGSSDSLASYEGADASARKKSGDGATKAAFELVLANDEGVEVLEPRDRRIRTRQKGLPHSKFSWLDSPRNALVVKKIHDEAATKMMRRAVKALEGQGITSWLERAVWDDAEDLQCSCKTWDDTDDTFRLDSIIDFVVVLGGDGTILWATKYFPKAMPPVVPFAMGSLGFLTSHRVEDMEKTLLDVCLGDFTLSLRSRLVAKVVTVDGKHSPWRYVLNEVLIDRGPKPVMVELDIAVDGYKVTKVAADGVIVATATGSTAYSLAAGGSMVHPGLPALLMTPICPHTLSFRPVVLPDSVVVTITCPPKARNTAWVAFDGKSQTELARGDSVVCRVAAYPVPTVCAHGENTDWFAAVKNSLGWNTRCADQKPHELSASPQ